MLQSTPPPPVCEASLSARSHRALEWLVATDNLDGEATQIAVVLSTTSCSDFGHSFASLLFSHKRAITPPPFLLPPCPAEMSHPGHSGALRRICLFEPLLLLSPLTQFRFCSSGRDGTVYSTAVQFDFSGDWGGPRIRLLFKLTAPLHLEVWKSTGGSGYPPSPLGLWILPYFPILPAFLSTQMVLDLGCNH